MLPKDRGEDSGPGTVPVSPRAISGPGARPGPSGGVPSSAATPSPIRKDGGSPGPELFSVSADLHPEPNDADLAEWVTDMRCAFTDLYGESIVGLPSDPRHLAKVLRRRASLARTYARYAEQAAFVADAIADREMED